MRRALSALALVATLAVAGCSGDSPTTPKGPKYPEVAGVYDFSAPVAEIPGARFSGTFTLSDDSRDTPGFTGSFSWTLLDQYGRSAGSGSGSIVNGNVTEAGRISFGFDSSNFHHDGTISGRNIATTWLLRGGTSNYSGTLTGSRR